MYHRSENPCQTVLDLPELNDNSTATAIGRIDQARYTQQNASRKYGCRQGPRRSRRRRPSESERTVAAGAGVGAVTVLMGAAVGSVRRRCSCGRVGQRGAGRGPDVEEDWDGQQGEQDQPERGSLPARSGSDSRLSTWLPTSVVEGVADNSWLV